MANISINQLAAEIAKGPGRISQDVVEKVNVSSDKVGKAAVKQTSPGKGMRNHGHYKQTKK